MPHKKREDVEEISEQELIIKDGSAVRAMIETRGWREVVKPILLSRRRTLIKEFTSPEVEINNGREVIKPKKYEDFVQIQQCVNAIDGLLSLVETIVAEGAKAFEERAKKQDKKNTRE